MEQQIYRQTSFGSGASYETGKQAGKFMLVGALNTLIDFAVLNILVYLGFTATLLILGQKFLVANIISVFIAMINSFILNKQWTFNAKEGNIYFQILSFLVITVFGMFVLHQIVFNALYYNLTFITSLVVGVVHFLKLNVIFSDNFVALNFSKVIAVAVSLVWNFLGYKFVVFKK